MQDTKPRRINADKPHLWKARIAASVDQFNQWFIRCAPQACRVSFPLLILTLFASERGGQSAEAGSGKGLAGGAEQAPEAPAIAARPVARNLRSPVAFTFAADGRIFYGERGSGRIRILDPSTSTDQLFFEIPGTTAAGGERGLLGLALHPRYPSRPFVYAFVTRLVGGQPRSQVVRVTDRGGTGSDLRVLFSDFSNDHHNGSRILFGKDGNLYVSIGDRGSSSDAQDLNSFSGKILRMTATGGIPAGNPIAGSYVYAYGLRNTFGFAFDPQTGRLWGTDNGPQCNDELNRVEAAANHGWGSSATCSSPPPAPRNTNQDGPAPVLPRFFVSSSIGVTGAAFCQGCGLGAANEGKLFFGAFVTAEIRRVTLNASRLSVSSVEIALRAPAKVLSMEVGPDGGLYFSSAGTIWRLVLK